MSITRAATSSVMRRRVSYCTWIDASKGGRRREGSTSRTERELDGSRAKRQELTLHCDYVGVEEKKLAVDEKKRSGRCRAISKSTELYRRMGGGGGGVSMWWTAQSDKKEEGCCGRLSSKSCVGLTRCVVGRRYASEVEDGGSGKGRHEH